MELITDKINKPKFNTVMNANPFFISVENLCLKYNDFPVLENISFQIKRNEITTIVGPSGTGKSSLLYAFNRMTDFNQNVQVSGHINCCNENYLTTKDISTVRSKFGLVFQKPNPFPVSIYKNLDIPLKENSSLNKSERKLKIEACLKDVGLWGEVKDRLNKPALLLSGGQQQRLCIARCLVLGPELILMDEPTSSLDPISEAKIEELMVKLKSKVTILLVTHKMNQMRKVSDNVVLFWPHNNKTTVKAIGPISEVLNHKSEDLFVSQYLNN